MCKKVDAFDKFCKERNITSGTNEWQLAKEAWNEGIKVCSDVVAQLEGMDYGLWDDYVVEWN